MSPLALSVRFLQTQPDRRLVELARAGHERAFEALVQRYRRPLLRYCRRLTPSEATGEDVLQQALMQAWVALGNPDVEVRDARAWLYRIVHNTAMSQLRRPVHDSLEASHTGLARGGEDELDRRLEARAALAGIASLPELQREVMLSTALEGRSHDEVADALGLSHGAVRGLIYRARATLRAAAAVVIPSPLVHWAARQGAGSGRSAAVIEALAGGGSAGIGGLIVKGGAVVAAAGALATAAGIADHGAHRRVHRVEAGILGRPGAHRDAATGAAVTAAFTTTSSSAVRSASGAGGQSGPAVRTSPRKGSRGSGRSGGAGSTGGGHDRQGLAPSNSGSGSSGGSGSGSGSRHDGGHGDGGSGSGGSMGSSGSSGSGGSEGSGSGSGSGGSRHESSGSSGSGGSGSGSGAGSGTGSGDGSGAGSQDGSGGSTTTTTATSAAAESGDGSGGGQTSSSGSASGSGTSSGDGGGGSDGQTTTTHG